jgi:hypothetical protein
MANTYRILSDISTLGPQGGTVTDAELDAQHLDAGLLIASGIIEPQTKPAKNQE